MSVSNNGHRGRLRWKIEKYGFDSLYAHELLEFMLFGVIPRRNTNHIAHELINRFGGYSNVFIQSTEDLMKVDGIGLSAALQIKSYAFHGEIGQSSVKDEKIISIGSARRFFSKDYFKTKCEEFHVVLIDKDGSVIEHEIFTSNHVAKVVVPISKIMKMVCEHNPNFVLLAHNHPSGNVLPSDRDIQFTIDLGSKLQAVMGINAYEHMIFAGKECYSFRNNCVLK